MLARPRKPPTIRVTSHSLVTLISFSFHTNLTLLTHDPLRITSHALNTLIARPSHAISTTINVSWDQCMRIATWMESAADLTLGPYIQLPRCSACPFVVGRTAGS